MMLIKSGVVYKKKGLAKYNIKRRLLLTNQPRLYFTTADAPIEYKCDILITPFVSAVLKSQDKFDIVCKRSGKHYALKVEGVDEASTWVTKINRVIEAATK